jgi:hypothetical protein
MMIDPFNLENLRLRPGFEKSVKVPISLPGKNRKRQKHFIMVPWTWHEWLLGTRHAATFKVAHHVLYQHWKNRGKPFTLSNVALDGVSRGQKSRALAELEALGLITVDRRMRKSPLIAVV